MLQHGRPAKRHEVPFRNWKFAAGSSRVAGLRPKLKPTVGTNSGSSLGFTGCVHHRPHPRSGALSTFASSCRGSSLSTNRSNPKEDDHTDWMTSILRFQCLRSRVQGELSAGRYRRVRNEEVPVVTGRISLHATNDAFKFGPYFRSSRLFSNRAGWLQNGARARVVQTGDLLPEPCTKVGSRCW